MLHMTEEDRPTIEANVDEYGDSYCRDISADDRKGVCASPFPVLYSSLIN
jgi:hypothetical protein